MPLPSGLQTVTITGTVLHPDGVPVNGTIRFSPEVSALTSGTEDVIVLGDTRVTLNTNGTFIATLLATDSTGVIPTNWTYLVTEQWSDATGRTYSISLPAASPNVNLADLAPAASSPGEGGLLVSSVDGLTGAVDLSGRYLALTGGAVTGYGHFNAGVGPNYATLPKGQVASNNAGLVVGSSYGGGDDDGVGTDSTGRINLYSYQRANVGSYGENIRNFAMRSDAKTMQAFYIPVQSGTKKGGYDPATRDPMASGIGWKPVVWQGAHYEANDHASIHGHWELEIADLNGALQGRLEIPFIDQATDASKALDQAAIGVAYTNIRTNLADLSVRAQNMTAGPYTGQNTAFRVGGNNAVNKDILLSISSDMGTVGRRWGIRATNETESGANAGTNFQVNRYDDTGTFLDSPVVVSRSTGNITLGPGLVARRASPTVSSLSLNSTSLGGGVGVVAIGASTTAPASNPTGGIVLYVTAAGRLKIRQPDGTDQFVALTAT